jgi:hypothetical protein
MTNDEKENDKPVKDTDADKSIMPQKTMKTQNWPVKWLTKML